MKSIDTTRFGGVWSATPTPFTNRMNVDTVAVKRLVEHHVRIGVKGLFVCGTCGEGPWMPDQERRAMVRTAAAASRGRLVIAAQVTDNSAARILVNMRAAAEDGADIAVIAPPSFMLNATPENVVSLYVNAIRGCPLPVGIYDRGTAGPVVVPHDALRRICSEPKVIMIKDSSANQERRALALSLRTARPALKLFNGDEFACADYLKTGYDGLLLGGGIFNGRLAGMILEAVRNGWLAEADHLQQRMNRLMYDVYGGKKITCWMSGLKHLMVEMGLFRTTGNYLNYPLTATCRRAIAKAMVREKEMLFP